MSKATKILTNWGFTSELLTFAIESENTEVDALWCENHLNMYIDQYIDDTDSMMNDLIAYVVEDIDFDSIANSINNQLQSK